MPLDPSQIQALFAKQREDGQYVKRVAEFMGISENELRRRMELAPRPAPKPTREERLRNIMEKRYGVPASLLDAYDDEQRAYDW